MRLWNLALLLLSKFRKDNALIHSFNCLKLLLWGEAKDEMRGSFDSLKFSCVRLSKLFINTIKFKIALQIQKVLSSSGESGKNQVLQLLSRLLFK